MTDRVYPFNRPAGPIQKPPGYNPNGAAKGGQMYRAPRPAYRPQPQRKRNRCCLCCIWIVIIFLVLLLLVGILGFVSYIIYRPQKPSFSVRTLQVRRLNVATKSGDNTRLNSEVVLEIEARNPNKKVAFFYDQSKVTVSSDNVGLGEGSFPAFLHGRKNISILKYDIKAQNAVIDEADGKRLKSKAAKGKLPLAVELHTHVSVQFGSWKSSKIKIVVACNAVQAAVSSKSKSSSSGDLETKCNLKLFKWRSFKSLK